MYESISDLDFNLCDVLTQTSILDNDFGLPHRGYFGDSITDIQGAINRGDETSLTSIRGVFDDGRYVSDTGKQYLYFLPLENVKKKQHRPFKSVEEMEKSLNISLGDVVYLRPTEECNKPKETILKLVYIESSPNEDMIGLGTHLFSLDELFNLFEISTDGEKFQTFGKVDQIPNAKDYVPQPPTVANDLVKTIRNHLYSIETHGIAEYIGEKGYFFDIDDAEAIADKIMTNDMSNARYGEFSGVSAASVMYPLLCEDSEGRESNWKFFVPEKYL